MRLLPCDGHYRQLPIPNSQSPSPKQRTRGHVRDGWGLEVVGGRASLDGWRVVPAVERESGRAVRRERKRQVAARAVGGREVGGVDAGGQPRRLTGCRECAREKGRQDDGEHGRRLQTIVRQQGRARSGWYTRAYAGLKPRATPTLCRRPRPAGVAELADAPDSKSGGPHGPCGFDPLLRHHSRAAAAGTTPGPPVRDTPTASDGVGRPLQV